MDKYIPALKYNVLTKYYDTVVELTTSEKVFKSDIVDRLNPTDGQRVLDMGCGTGTLTAMIKKAYPGLDVTGLDADESALGIARHKVSKLALEIDFECANATELPFPSSTFERVVSSLFFHHLLPAQKQQALLEVQRVLKPGGVFFLADWGVPKSLREKIGYFLVQLLDGFETTDDNKRGRLPEYCIDTGFTTEVINRYSVPLGDITLLRAVKQPDEVNNAQLR